MGLVGVCLALLGAAGAGADSAVGKPVFIPVQQFTLAWIHTIEKVRWEEDYALAAVAEGVVLKAVAARVRGSAAGMEPPPDAQLKNGWYEYKPQISQPEVLRLSRSAFAADYEFCSAGLCRPMSDFLPSDGGITLVTACQINKTDGLLRATAKSPSLQVQHGHPFQHPRIPTLNGYGVFLVAKP